MTCGFVVFAAVKQFEVNGAGLLELNSLIENEPVASPALARNKIENKSDSQVRTVIELVGAFENLKTQDAEAENPLDLPNEYSQTAKVAVYAPPSVSREDTNDFLSQINMDGPHRSVIDEAATKIMHGASNVNDSEEALQASDESLSAERIAMDAGKSETAKDAVSQPSAESSIELDEPRIEEAVSDEISIELVDSAPESPTESETAIEDSLPETEPTAVDLAVGDVTVEKLVVDNSTIAPTEETVERPATYESPEVTKALAAYETARVNLASSPADRTLARRYYATLAELAQEAHTRESAEAMEAIGEVYSNSTLFDIASSAASSWINWPKRKLSGVVVAGKIAEVVDNADGVLVGIQTTDRRSSIVSVFVEDELASELTNRIGEDLVFAGIATDEQINDAPLVVGRLLLQ